MRKIFSTLVLVFFIMPAYAEWAKPSSLDEYGIQVEAVTNVDGTITLFFIEPDKEIAFIRQTEAGVNTWTKRKSLEMYGNFLRTGMHEDGRIELFIIGTLGNVLTHATETSVGSGEFGKELDFDVYATQLEVAHSADGSLMLFYTRPDREVAYVKQKALNSADWEKAVTTDVYANQIAVGNHADGRIEIVNIGTLGNVLYHVTETAPGSNQWSKEMEIKGEYGFQIELMNNADGSLVLYYLTMDRELAYMKSAESGFAKPVKTDVYGNAFDLDMDGDGRVHIVNIATMGNALYHLAQTEANSESWTKEKDLNSYGRYIDVATNGKGGMELFIVAMLASELYQQSDK